VRQEDMLKADKCLCVSRRGSESKEERSSVSEKNRISRKEGDQMYKTVM
jgi:hypothetical protein